MRRAIEAEEQKDVKREGLLTLFEIVHEFLVCGARLEGLLSGIVTGLNIG